jgi:hypothetical protein
MLPEGRRLARHGVFRYDLSKPRAVANTHANPLASAASAECPGNVVAIVVFGLAADANSFCDSSRRL